MGYEELWEKERAIIKEDYHRGFEDGYLNGQLDAAESELWVLYKLLSQMPGQHNETDLIMVRIRETEEFLKKYDRYPLFEDEEDDEDGFEND